MKPWHRLPRAAVDVPSLEELKARLYETGTGQPELVGVNWPTAGDWGCIGSKVPSNLSHSMIL